ncbi:hypothetical protein GGTG_09277 [Gaeumannomyces tritici R3-111a-1]|uniref:Uncharacterized protein n=1 Tax=Gaeumannomyces tritici (strain R3-111a-1) TaxID=644352 RepID=J3P6Y1_GAET3|nr:hypothetical protein GGTG_09277 [Gaeumannomyces tritici R3-111a-1]EJT72411.1 hypothetical protein GGTG_09277 [Gaeumannomyces tritici R3-111a-1]
MDTETFSKPKQSSLNLRALVIRHYLPSAGTHAQLKMHLPTILLPTVLLITPVISHPAPSAQLHGALQCSQAPMSPEPLQCANGLKCSRDLPMTCQNGQLICTLAPVFTFPIGKCSEYTGSMCAGPSDTYPGDTTLGRENTTERECACVSWDGKGYYTRGEGKQCPVADASEWMLDMCNPQDGFLCSFVCNSKLRDGFTNEKCDTLFPGTRAHLCYDRSHRQRPRRRGPPGTVTFGSRAPHKGTCFTLGAKA